MGCCGGPGQVKKYSFKEYLISAVSTAAFVLLVYFLSK